MRKHGARSFRAVLDGEPFIVEFFPTQPLAPPVEAGPTFPKSVANALAMDEEKCPCGHGFSSHNDEGLCLQACSPVACQGKQADDSGKLPVTTG
jgi:hypothetical protein